MVTTLDSIKKQSQSGPVVIYMKGTPDMPQCGFSARAYHTLKTAGATAIQSVDILSDPQLKETLKQYTGWPTFPQVFIHGKFIGGCDIVTQLFEEGELQKLLQPQTNSAEMLSST